MDDQGRKVPQTWLKLLFTFEKYYEVRQDILNESLHHYALAHAFDQSLEKNSVPLLVSKFVCYFNDVPHMGISNVNCYLYDFLLGYSFVPNWIKSTREKIIKIS